MFCIRCGSKIVEGAEFCSNCGWKALTLTDIKCVKCGATLHYSNNEDSICCEYCGTNNIINDETTAFNRLTNAKMKAKKAEMELDFQKTNHDQIVEVKKFILENLIFCIVAVLLLIYSLTRILKGQFAGIDIILVAIILTVVWNKTHNKKG